MDYDSHPCIEQTRRNGNENDKHHKEKRAYSETEAVFLVIARKGGEDPGEESIAKGVGSD